MQLVYLSLKRCWSQLCPRVLRITLPQTRGHVIPALAEPDLQRLRAFLQEQQEAVAAERQQEGAALAEAGAGVAAQPGSRL